MKILITGAAGNLGSRLAQHLIPGPHQLRLMVQKSPIPFNISGHANVSIYRADLARPHTLPMACEGIDCIVHFAGILFAPLPEKFLPLTNVGYVKNLVEAAKTAGVRKFILISFPMLRAKLLRSTRHLADWMRPQARFTSVLASKPKDTSSKRVEAVL